VTEGPGTRFPDSPTKAPGAPLQAHKGENGESVRDSGPPLKASSEEHPGGGLGCGTGGYAGFTPCRQVRDAP
jgi:hypothetical protein